MEPAFDSYESAAPSIHDSRHSGSFPFNSDHDFFSGFGTSHPAFMSHPSNATDSPILRTTYSLSSSELYFGRPSRILWAIRILLSGKKSVHFCFNKNNNSR